jgi:hypothetical protein
MLATVNNTKIHSVKMLLYEDKVKSSQPSLQSTWNSGQAATG